jgi:hypothetical protein
MMPMLTPLLPGFRRAPSRLLLFPQVWEVNGHPITIECCSLDGAKWRSRVLSTICFPAASCARRTLHDELFWDAPPEDLPIGEDFCRRHDSRQGQSLVRLRQLHNHLRKVIPDCWKSGMEIAPQLQIIGHYSFDADPLRLQIQPKTPTGNHDGIFRREPHFSQSPCPATQVATFLQRPRLSQKSCSKKWRASVEMCSVCSVMYSCVNFKRFHAFVPDSFSLLFA